MRRHPGVIPNPKPNPNPTPNPNPNLLQQSLVGDVGGSGRREREREAATVGPAEVSTPQHLA